MKKKHDHPSVSAASLPSVERRRLFCDVSEDAEGGAPVGYKSPPKHTRFKKGQSGNPKGRPKGTRNFTTDVRATLKAPVNVTRDGVVRRVSTQEAALLRLREMGLGGNERTLKQLIDLAREFSDEAVQSADETSDDERLLEVYRTRVLTGAATEPSSEVRGDEAQEPELPGEGNTPSSRSSPSSNKKS